MKGRRLAFEAPPCPAGRPIDKLAWRERNARVFREDKRPCNGDCLTYGTFVLVGAFTRNVNGICCTINASVELGCCET